MHILFNLDGELFSSGLVLLSGTTPLSTEIRKILIKDWGVSVLHKGENHRLFDDPQWVREHAPFFLWDGFVLEKTDEEKGFCGFGFTFNFLSRKPKVILVSQSKQANRSSFRGMSDYCDEHFKTATFLSCLISRWGEEIKTEELIRQVIDTADYHLGFTPTVVRWRR